MSGSLRIENLRLPRGTLPELSIEFGNGVHLLTGPNGIGKTTLLLTIAGSLPATAGRVLFDGQPVDQRAGQVVLAPNAPPEIPWIRSGMLLDFIVSLYPATRRDKSYADTLLAELGLSAYLDAPLGTLSAGTARKLLLAAGLVAAPPVMLFDEPTNDIDAASIRVFIERVGEAARQRVVLITTHHTADLAALEPRLHALVSRP